ncbi:type II toxin-antitoxin system HipA family toxin [Rhodopseudomonas palustris]|uniref:HipA-like n=1 Tax=Rhodopseudomonas palustris (strain BisB18) TaxID=316056 RepID=Q20YW6_RHOPB
MTTSDVAFVFTAVPDGIPALVGRYRHLRAGASKAFGEFQYVGSWLRRSDAFPLDPVNLPLSRETFTTVKRGRLHGALADATPDRWGRELAILATPGKIFSPVDWLHVAGPDRVGSLAFSSDTDMTATVNNARLGLGSLEAIAAEFEKIEAGLPASPEAKRIYDAGVSMGGARPKAVLDVDGALWIAKFERKTDTFDQCGAEHATMRLAATCGIDVPETRLVQIGFRNAVLVKRFDRSPAPDFAPTVHFLSALSLLNGDETVAEGSYAAIAAELLRHGARPDEDRRELFRRMIFNVLCGNRDDHLKNHAFIYDGREWRLSPAFDVVPQPDMQPEHAIALGRLGVFPSIANCLSRCGDFGLSREAAASEVERLARQVREWRSFFEAEGISQATIERIASAFKLADEFES